MGKKKWKKAIQMNTSPESYIKTRARNLPIGKCYINENWQDQGLATIIVTRNHINGNFTFGSFLVDLYCLGIKDAMYDFNRYTEYHDLLDKFNEQYPMIEIDYPLAHNIIYGSLEYAAALGFKPVKDFEVSQYILEEDDDRIELVEIEFGYKGKPAILVGKEKHPANIIATLERTVGKGNFIVISQEDLDSEEDDEYDEELTDEKIKDIVEGRKKPSPTDIALLTLPSYEEICTKKEKEEMYRIIDELEALEVVQEDDTDDPLFLNEESKTQYALLYEKIEQDPEGTLPEIEALVAENPYDYSYFSLLSSAYSMLNDKEKINEIIISGYGKFPQKISAFNSYVIILSEQDNTEDLKRLIGSNFYFHQFFPNRQKISFNEMVSLVAALFLYFSRVLHEIHKAVAYAITLCNFIFYNSNKAMADDILFLAYNLMMQEIDNKEQFEDQ